MENKYITVKEMMEYVSFSRETMRQILRNQNVPYEKIGNTKMYDRETVKRLFDDMVERKMKPKPNWLDQGSGTY